MIEPVRSETDLMSIARRLLARGHDAIAAKRSSLKTSFLDGPLGVLVVHAMVESFSKPSSSSTTTTSLVSAIDIESAYYLTHACQPPGPIKAGFRAHGEVHAQLSPRVLE